MTPQEIAWLRSTEGERALAEAQAARRSGERDLAVIDRLRRRLPPERSRAVLALLEGRAAAESKFADAARLYFDRAAAEQATRETVARHTARRFAGRRRVADLGCGAGGDALAIAEVAPVLAVDRDPGRLAMLEANAEIRGLRERVETHLADLETFVVPQDADGIWLDPARREERGRTLDPVRWSPPLGRAIEIARSSVAAGIKLAPGIDSGEVPPDGELEFVSSDGRLVEAVLWLGAAAASLRSATVLPAGETLRDDGGGPAGPLADPGRYLYDPNPGVGRAGLVATLARRLAAWQIDERIAYLSSNEAVDSLFARRYRIAAWLPFAERALAAQLRELDAGRVDVMRRGSPVDTNALELRLNRSLQGRRAWTVALTRVRGRHVAIVAERERGAPQYGIDPSGGTR